MDSADPNLELAWDHLERGDPVRALELLRAVPEARAERWVPEALAWIDLQELQRAGAALERARELGLSHEDESHRWVQGELALRLWRLSEAERAFRRLTRGSMAPDAHERLSCIAELHGDLRSADRLYQKARAADPESYPPVARLSASEFAAVVRAAIEELPAPYREILADTEVIVAPVPSAELVIRGREAETPPDLLGLFSGPSRLEQAEDAGPEPPPVVYLFQRNLERSSAGADELREQIAVTLYHELGHLLGFEEEGVEEMGLG